MATKFYGRCKDCDCMYMGSDSGSCKCGHHYWQHVLLQECRADECYCPGYYSNPGIRYCARCGHYSDHHSIVQYDKVDGSLQWEEEYQIQQGKPGLIVILKSALHQYDQIVDNEETRLSFENQHEADARCIRDVFGLNEKSENLIECTVHSTLSVETPTKKSFGQVLASIIDSYESDSLSFIFVALLTNGVDKETFLLNSSKNCSTSSGACHQTGHEHEGSCNRRKVKQLVEPIQKAYSDKPLVFFLHFNRGTSTDSVRVKAKPVADKYIPAGSDTFLLYPCIEGFIAHGDENGSELFREFRGIAKEMDAKAKEVEEDLKELNDKTEDDEVRKLLGKRQVEDFVEGWIDNIAVSLSRKIANKQQDTDKYTNYKQQPIFHSCLRKKLSLLKMMRNAGRSDCS